MAEEFKPGCARPTGGPVGGDSEPAENVQKAEQKPEKEATGMIKVGQKAPDFTAPAYHQGKFINVKLSDYLGINKRIKEPQINTGASRYKLIF